jgi:dienelactone hydrolase
MPPGAGRHPVILLLHSDGGLPLQAARFEEMARALARRDYIVEIVHYFDRTGTIAADPAQRMAHLREWVGTVRDAMTDVAHAPRADSTRIGLYGTGLGGTLALVAGAEDPRVRAVVESDGTLPAWAVPTVHRMPAVFIARSATEGSAASRESDRVEAACKAVGAPVENQEYDEASRNGGRMVAKDLRQRGFAFLEQYVMGPAGDQVRRGSR